jgi:hypothetical protein
MTGSLQKQLPVFDYSFDLKKSQIKKTKNKNIQAISKFEGPKISIAGHSKKKNKTEIKKIEANSNMLAKKKASKKKTVSTSLSSNLLKTSSFKRLDSTSFDQLLTKLDD